MFHYYLSEMNSMSGELEGDNMSVIMPPAEVSVCYVRWISWLIICTYNAKTVNLII